jgi:hypothetical protein
LVNECLPQLHAIYFIDAEHRDSGPPYLSAAKQHRPNPFEVTLPALTARIEEQDDVASQGITATQIGPLLKITESANVRRIKLTGIDPVSRFR